MYGRERKNENSFFRVEELVQSKIRLETELKRHQTELSRHNTNNPEPGSHSGSILRNNARLEEFDRKISDFLDELHFVHLVDSRTDHQPTAGPLWRQTFGRRRCRSLSPVSPRDTVHNSTDPTVVRGDKNFVGSLEQKLNLIRETMLERHAKFLVSVYAVCVLHLFFRILMFYIFRFTIGCF